jgi:hypothetical protein
MQCEIIRLSLKFTTLYCVTSLQGSTGAMAETFKQTDLAAFGKAQTEGILNMQKELLDTYEQVSRAWLDRAKSKMELWSRLGAKMTATRSIPEAIEVYQNCLAEQMQMTAEDGKRLFDDCQKITQKIARSLSEYSVRPCGKPQPRGQRHWCDPLVCKLR